VRLTYNPNIQSITTTKEQHILENCKITMLCNVSKRQLSWIRSKQYLLLGWQTPTSKWVSIKTQRVTIKKLMNLVTTMTTRGWQERWIRRQILAKKKDFSLNCLVDQNISQYIKYQSVTLLSALLTLI
jgi:hypothetical protein